MTGWKWDDLPEEMRAILMTHQEYISDWTPGDFLPEGEDHLLDHPDSEVRGASKQMAELRKNMLDRLCTIYEVPMRLANEEKAESPTTTNAAEPPTTGLTPGATWFNPNNRTWYILTSSAATGCLRLIGALAPTNLVSDLPFVDSGKPVPKGCGDTSIAVTDTGGKLLGRTVLNPAEQRFLLGGARWVFSSSTDSLTRESEHGPVSRYEAKDIQTAYHVASEIKRGSLGWNGRYSQADLDWEADAPPPPRAIHNSKPIQDAGEKRFLYWGSRWVFSTCGGSAVYEERGQERFLISDAANVKEALEAVRAAVYICKGNKEARFVNWCGDFTLDDHAWVSVNPADLRGLT